MKESPELHAVEQRMQPGSITRDGFLGDETRPLGQILEEDAEQVRRLGLTHGQIARRMEHFTEEGRGGLGTTVVVDEDYEVRVETVRGMLPCPWGHAGVYPKVNVWLKNRANGEELMWTALNIHMIGEHGFYEGRGGGFRIDPARAKRALGL